MNSAKWVYQMLLNLPVMNVFVAPLAINPLTTNVPNNIETSQLSCSANALTGFYMIGEHWSLMG